MAEYILCRDEGSEGHSKPLLALSESDVRVVLQVLAHSYDGGLAIYKVDTASGYGRDWNPAVKSQRIKLEHFLPPKTSEN